MSGAPVCFVSNNYSPALANTSVKMRALLSFAEEQFGRDNVVRVPSSRFDDIRAAWRTRFRSGTEGPPGGGRAGGAGSKSDGKVQDFARSFYLSSGSDLDPGKGTSPADMVRTVRWFLDKGWSVHLICWAFQTFLAALQQTTGLEVVRVSGTSTPEKARKETRRRFDGQKKNRNTFHRVLGQTVVAHHNFAAVVPAAKSGDRETWRQKTAAALSRFVTSQTPQSVTGLPDVQLETYSRAGRTVLAFFSAGPFLIGSQFHPEIGVRHTGKAPLFHLLQRQRTPEKFESLLPFFIPESHLRAPENLENPSSASRFVPCRPSRWFQPYVYSTPSKPPNISEEHVDRERWAERAVEQLTEGLDSFVDFVQGCLLRLYLKPSESGIDRRQVRQRQRTIDSGPLPAKNWLSNLLGKHFQRRCTLIVAANASKRPAFKKPMDWPQPQNFNGGFQPSNQPAIFVFRQEGLAEVARHEVCHLVFDSGLVPQLQKAAATAQRLLCKHHGDLLCPRRGAVFRAEEGFIELFANCSAIEQFARDRSRTALQTFSALYKLFEFLKSRCDHLAAATDWVEQRCLVQKSCVFSYFFVRLSLLFNVLEQFLCAPLPVCSSEQVSNRPAPVAAFLRVCAEENRVAEVVRTAVELLKHSQRIQGLDRELESAVLAAKRASAHPEADGGDGGEGAASEIQILQRFKSERTDGRRKKQSYSSSFRRVINSGVMTVPVEELFL